MSTPLPPLTEADLAAMERHCTTQAWPAHVWERIVWKMVCRQCDAEAMPAAVNEGAAWLPPHCRRRAEPLSPSSALRLVAEVRRLRAALTSIRREEGRVCPEFELCDHAACRSSHAAWEIADAALGGERSER